MTRLTRGQHGGAGIASRDAITETETSITDTSFGATAAITVELMILSGL